MMRIAGLKANTGNQMKIQLLSDLHFEFWKCKYIDYSIFQTDADALVLAGDIDVGTDAVNAHLNQFAKMYAFVVYVPGNHEYYRGGSLVDFERKLDIPHNVHVLNPGACVLNGVTFIGATLWTNFRDDDFVATLAKTRINDFRVIKDFSPKQAQQKFRTDFQCIKHWYEDSFTEKKVIITHFLPAEECISPYWQVHGGELNKYFANDLGDWIGTLSNTTWMFGHTHDSVDQYIGDTRMLCNPFGYYGSRDENKQFDPKKVYDLS